MFTQELGYTHIKITQEDVDSAKVEGVPSSLPALRRHFKSAEIYFNLPKETILVDKTLYLCWGELNPDIPGDLILRNAERVFHQNIPEDHYPAKTEAK